MASELIVQTIQGPSSGANANKVLIPSGHTLDVSGGTLVPSAGAVVQVLHGTYNTQIENTSTSYIDTGLALSITPTSTSSKILIMVDQHVRYSSTSDQGVGFKIFRDSTAIFTSSTTYDEYHYDGENSTNFDTRGRRSITWLDSPSTTNPTTYKVQVALYSGTYSPFMRLQDNNNYSFITLMEIAQ